MECGGVWWCVVVWCGVVVCGDEGGDKHVHDYTINPVMIRYHEKNALNSFLSYGSSQIPSFSIIIIAAFNYIFRSK